MAWKLSQPLIQRIMVRLKENNCDSCRKCGEKFELGKRYMFNRHNNKYGMKSKWYCVSCFERIWL